MRARCDYRFGKDLPIDRQVSGITEKSEFGSLYVGQIYEVFGIMLHRNRVDFLILANSKGPEWLPATLFGVLEHSLPAWKICMTSEVPEFKPLYEDFGILSILSYERLTSDFDHYLGLIERESPHLDYFFEIVKSHSSTDRFSGVS